MSIDHHHFNTAFEAWNTAIQTQDSEQVLALYHPDAILVPTLSNTICSTRDTIKDYFEHFLTKKPSAEITESHERFLANHNLAINSGLYTFTLGDGSVLHARFSYIYQIENDNWLILEHHSSQLPL